MNNESCSTLFGGFVIGCIITAAALSFYPIVQDQPAKVVEVGAQCQGYTILSTLRTPKYDVFMFMNNDMQKFALPAPQAEAFCNPK